MSTLLSNSHFKCLWGRGVLTLYSHIISFLKSILYNTNSLTLLSSSDMLFPSLKENCGHDHHDKTVAKVDLK